ncbi:MAG: DUF2065 domain-containing protein [Pseudomonadota bacterium]
MSWIFLALGLVLIVEGLVYALAPSLIEELLQALKSLTIEARRLMGLAALTTGAALILLASWIGF